VSSVETQLAQLQAQLHDLADSMTLAARTGQTQALAMFKAQFRQLSAQAATLRSQASQADQPAAFLQSLDRFSDDAIALGRKVGAPVDDLLRSTSTVAKLLPLLLVVLVGGLVWWALKGNLKVSV
jgi:hypothetical protein